MSRSSETLDLGEPTGRLILGGVVLVEVITYVLSAGTLIDHDSLVMGEVARRIADGSTLYIDAWDNKPPLALLFYLPAQVLAPGSYLGQQMLGALWTLLGGLLTFSLLRGETRLVRYGATCLAILFPLSRVDFVWTSSEDAVNLFTLALVLIGYRILRRGDWQAWEIGATGLIAVLAFHARQTGLFFTALPIMAVGMTAVSWRRAAGAVGQALLGALIGGLLIAGLIAATGDFGAYFDAVFVGPQRYGTFGLHHVHWVLREQLITGRGQIYFIVALLGVLLASGWRQRLFAVSLLAVACAAVLAPMKPFGHYQQQLAPAMVLSTVFILRGLQERSRQVGLAFAATLLAFFVINAAITAELLRNDHGERRELERVVTVLEQNHDPDATLLAVGDNSAYLYFRSKLRPVHTFHWDLFFDADDFMPVDPQHIVAEILQDPPSWLVVHAASLTPTAEGVEEKRRIQLVRQLRATQTYREAARTEHWRILQRQLVTDTISVQD